MNLESVITKLLRNLNKQIDTLSISVTSGNVDSMEKYKYMLGQAQAYTFISGEISNLLNKGAKNEDKEGTVINLDGKDRNPKA